MKRQFWSYCGLNIAMRSTLDWLPDKDGQWQRAQIQQTRGLNLTHNHHLKAIFNGAATSLGVMILRLKRQDVPRSFKVPGGPFNIPILGALASGGLMYTATTHTLIWLFAWTAIGLVIYFFYGRKHSKLRKS